MPTSAKNADLEAPLLQSAAVPSEARFDATFREMQLRKLRRVLHVLRSQQGMCRLGWVLAYVGALTAALLAASVVEPEVASGLNLHAGPSERLMSLTLCVAALGTNLQTVQQGVLWRWCSFWAYVGGLVLIVTHDFAPPHAATVAATAAATADAGGAARSAMRWRAAAVLAGLELLTVCGYWLLHCALPACALRLVEWLPVRWLWRIGPLHPADDPGPDHGVATASSPPMQPPHASTSTAFSASYRPRIWLGGTSSLPWRCAYRGETSASGMPHGYGEWSDDSPHGEGLRGHWDQGRPAAPFSSREFGSGHTVRCVRLAYCASHADPFDSSSPIVRRLPGGQLRFGVCDVECEVGGHYFRHYPLAAPPQELPQGLPPVGGNGRAESATQATAMAAALHTCLGLLNTDAASPLSNGAASPLSNGAASPLSNGAASPLLPAAASRPSEAVLYLPGFNTPLSWAAQRMGQLLALARLPSHIKPVLLSWPGGWAMSYLAARSATRQPWMADDLLHLLESLAASGITRVHILAHSMGAAVLLHALPRLLAAPSFERSGVRLANVVLLSPDFPLHAFEEGTTRLLEFLAAAHGTLTTIYGDRHDKPLGYGELMNRFVMRPEEGWRSLGRLWPVRGLDCDIIDTTWMQAGLPAGEPDLAINTAMRHSQFTINQHVVNDIVECITTGQRASKRTGLARVHRAEGVGGSGGDVFRFQP